ncbi:MAG: hypothetical protein ACXU82_01605 [Caulobacteraceae bacterium]
MSTAWNGTSRRSIVLGAGAAALWPLGSAWAQGAPGGAPGAGPAGPGPRPAGPPPTPEQIAAQLPLKSTGIEHVSFWVPDVAEAGAFYGKVFNPALHKEKDPPLRYYVPLTTAADPKPPLAYIAIGAANGRPTQIDHYCVLAQDYNPAAMTERLKQEGVRAAQRGVFIDDDGLQLQVLGTPAGLAPTTEPAGRISPDAPIFEPIGIENVVVQVPDLDRSAAYYRRFLNGKTTREGDRLWIDVANTRLALEKMAPGAKPVISSFCARVRPFDRAAVTRKLQALGAEIIPAGKVDGDVLRFRSPMGLVVDVKAVRS